MKQVFHNYQKWECYKNKMWHKVSVEKENIMLQKSIDFIGDHYAYGNAMKKVIVKWPVTCEHHLTDKSINRRAFIGHAAVSFELGIPEYITRMAWHYLSKEQQDLANAQADSAIKQWELNYKKTQQPQLI